MVMIEEKWGDRQISRIHPPRTTIIIEIHPVVKINIQYFPQTYKSYFLCSDVMVNPVSSPVVTWVLTFVRTFALGVAGIVADESGAADQQVKQEAEHLHADGDEKEDERVPPLVGDQQLGEDARQGDDHPCCAWTRTEQGKEEEVRRT